MDGLKSALTGKLFNVILTFQFFIFLYLIYLTLEVSMLINLVLVSSGTKRLPQVQQLPALAHHCVS